jgi:hypothetical protein
MPSTENSPQRPLIAGLTILAAALLVLGAGLWWTEPATGFGWFAYEPINEDMLSAMVVMTGRRYAAVAAFGAGLLLFAGLAGFAIGQRSARPADAA